MVVQRVAIGSVTLRRDARVEVPTGPGSYGIARSAAVRDGDVDVRILRGMPPRQAPMPVSVPGPTPEPEPKPMDIETFLHWVYGRQRADWIIDNGIGLHSVERACQKIQDDAYIPLDAGWDRGISGCGCSTVERYGTLETFVDGGGAIYDAGRLHPDAETAHLVAREHLDWKVKALVFKHARVGDRPEWSERKPQRILPILNGKGRPVVRFQPWDKHHDYGYCPVTWDVDPAFIEMINATYAAWWRALVDLCRVFNELTGERRLSRRVLPPSAPAQPWDCGKSTSP